MSTKNMRRRREGKRLRGRPFSIYEHNGAGPIGGRQKVPKSSWVPLWFSVMVCVSVGDSGNGFIQGSGVASGAPTPSSHGHGRESPRPHQGTARHINRVGTAESPLCNKQLVAAGCVVLYCNCFYKAAGARTMVFQ